MPDVSYVVILTRGAERAAVALRSIALQEPDAELLLVLNEADDAMRELARATSGARILHDGADLGVVLGWNLGLREAASPRLCVLHEDSNLQPGCAARLLKTMRERPDAGAVGPRHLWTDGSLLNDGSIIWSDGATTRCTHRTGGEVVPSDYLASACVMLDRDAVIGVGGFDLRFFPAIYVDAAMGCALWESGRTVLCDPRATNLHHTAAMVDTARGPRRGLRFRHFLLNRNRARFQAVWADLLKMQAPRRNTIDASQPEPAEIADADARVRARELRVLAGEVHGGHKHSLDFPADLEAHAIALRRELEDEFLALLVDREATLEAELRRVHGAYAELWESREAILRAAQSAGST